MSLRVSQENISYASNKFQFNVTKKLEGSLRDLADNRDYQLKTVLDGRLLCFAAGEYHAYVVLDETFEIHQTTCGVQLTPPYIPKPQPPQLTEASELMQTW